MTIAVGQVEARRSLADFDVEIESSFASRLDLWESMARMGHALPFQSRAWLQAWGEAFGQELGSEILAVTIRDRDGNPVLALPLVKRRVGLLTSIEFADGGVADYNAPILGPRAPQTADGARRIWRALLDALPRSDVIHLERMPLRVGSAINPLSLLTASRPSGVSGLAVTLPEGYASWRQALPRRFRMELGRCERLFEALPEARFRRIGPDEPEVFAAIERLQRARIAALGKPYILDETGPAAFYHHLARDEAHAILTAALAGDAVVAALFGLRHGSHYVMLRIAADPAQARLSPGRLVISKTIEALSADGVTTFDFALGDYTYKRRLGGEPVPLCELLHARSILGLHEAALFRLKAFIRGDPKLRALAKRVRGVIRPAAPDQPGKSF